MSSPRYVKLNNGAILDLDQIAQIARKDLNEYGIVTRPSGVTIRADSDDVKFVESLLNVMSTPKPEADPVVVAAA